MNKDKTQLLRLIFIDQKIRQGMQSGHYANCSSMAAEYEVSTKSILRDIDYLKNQRDAPIAYDASKKGYYYTEETYALPALDISASDLFAIAVTEKVLRQHRGTPIYQKLHSVFDKISASLPERISIEPSWVDSRITVIGDSPTTIKAEIWTSVAKSLHENRVLKISYQSPSANQSTERSIEPYQLVNYQGEWYVIGYCRKRSAILTFAISRIQKASLSKSVFTLPEDFDYEAMLRGSFGIFSGNREHQVVIRFAPDKAPYIRERTWHPSQQIDSGKDGSVTLTITTTHLLEIKQWILSWGAGAEVLAPEQLRDEVAAETQKMAGLYND